MSEKLLSIKNLKTRFKVGKDGATAVNGISFDIFKGETISRYDPNGNKVESSWYDSDGNLTEGDWGYSKSISKYDTKNRIVELIKYNFGLKFGQLQQTLTEKYIYEYEEY